MSKSNDKNTQEWIAPPQASKPLKAGLYIISTPIGNMRDMSLRALDTLAAADCVLCEDTRISGKLLKYFGLHKPLLVYNDHSDERKRASILARVETGESVALISDAGTPLISDPGYKLVHEMRDAGLYVTTVPGANAPLSALQLSALPSDRFSFIGFLPSKETARNNLLSQWKDVPSTLVMFETAPRLLKALEAIQVLYGARQVSVCREITKMYEEARNGSAAELITHYEEQGLPKGEIVIVIAPPEDQAFSDADLEKLLKSALQSMRTKEAAEFVAAQTGASKKVLYDMALELSS